MKLRPYQRGAIDKVRSVWDSGQPNALIVLPTGSGKTVVFAALGREFRMEMDDGGRVLVLAHRTELIEQARDKWLKVEPDATVGIYQGSKREVWADVICASVQSCYPDKRADGECDCVTTSAIGGVAVKDPANGCIVCGGTGIVKDRLVRKGRIHDLPLAKIALVIFDECHHMAADSYVAVLDAVRAANPDAVMLGVTATPFRNDGKGLGRFWDRVAYRMSIADAIRDGYLVPLRGLRVELQIDLADVKVSKGSGDFVDASLGEVIDTDEARREIVRAWRQNVGPGTTDGGPAGRKTAAFTPTVAAAQHLAAEFVDAGIAADWISGELARDERKKRLAAFADGRTQVMVNCQVLTEGFDEPSIRCVLLARPTKSVAMYAQMIGRGTRLLGLTYEESVAAGKPDCIVMDCVGASRLGLASLADLSAGTETHVPGIDPEPEEEPEEEQLFDVEPRTVTIRGVSTYEIDLFGGAVAWARIRGSRVATVDIGCSVIVYPADGGFSAVAVRGGGVEFLADRVAEVDALRVAEAFALEHGKAKYLQPNAFMQRKPATDKQIAMLRHLVHANVAAPSKVPFTLADVPDLKHMSRPLASLWIAYLRCRLDWRRKAKVAA